MHEILIIVTFAMLIHSVIGTVIFIATNENEDFAVYYAIGFVGWIVCLIGYVYRLLKRMLRHYTKRSIFEDEEGSKFYCPIKYCDDFYWHYKMVRRYAAKEEWKNLRSCSEEEIKQAIMNCDRCKYDKECKFDLG
jgi:hypothetical protein